MFQNNKKNFTCEIESTSGETLEIKEEFIEIEYVDSETSKIKEKIIEDQKTTGEKLNKKYELKVCTVDTKETDHFSINDKSPTHKERIIHISKQDPDKKYKCEKCARSYSHKSNFYRHQKFEIEVIRQFSCKFCNKSYKQKVSMDTHVARMHQKTNTKKSVLRHMCDKCFRRYTRLDSLQRHKLLDHAKVQRQFICNFCGNETNVKSSLYVHITSRHMNE
ncbi:zinc finger protein 43-like [Belonocnema kinseyi]|uniref:zinc finger protein 43-like n=1 Tax=Belonocnema kinseyi TaxID=2817044 RepID=UPI00143DB45B|nr:zinc finger protein 43-like [Belonocnema kinseyi]